MKCILRNYGVRMTTEQRQVARATARDMTLTRGTSKIPSPPQDVQAQSGPRGVLITWGLPPVYADIQRWRVYKGDENTLYHELTDRGTRQIFIEATAGSSPPVNNFFVSSLNAIGLESNKVLVQGSATAEASAPSMPTVPPEYNSSSGSNQTTNYYYRVYTPGRNR